MKRKEPKQSQIHYGYAFSGGEDLFKTVIITATAILLIGSLATIIAFC